MMAADLEALLRVALPPLKLARRERYLKVRRCDPVAATGSQRRTLRYRSRRASFSGGRATRRSASRSAAIIGEDANAPTTGRARLTETHGQACRGRYRNVQRPFAVR